MKQKKAIWMIAVSLALLLVLVGCNRKDSEEQATTTVQSTTKAPITEVDGFESYESKQSKIKLQYPQSWLMIDQETAASEKLEDLLVEVFSEYSEISTSAIKDALKDNEAIWYDTEGISEDYVSTIGLMVSENTSLTSNSLRKETVQKQLGQNIKESVEVYDELETVRGQEFGHQYYVLFQYKTIIDDRETSVYQAATIYEDNIYFFSLVALPDMLDAEIPTFNQMLSTVEFID